MHPFIFAYLALFSFGVLLVLIVRSWPRLKDQRSEPQGTFGHWVLVELPTTFDQLLNRSTEKLFRRLKIIVLKFDNYLTERLKMLNLGTKDKPKIDFKEIENTNEMTQVRGK